MRQSTRSATWSLTGKLDRDPPIYFPGDTLRLTLTLDVLTGKGASLMILTVLISPGVHGKSLVAKMRRQGVFRDENL